MRIDFFKYQGAGNDFVIIDNRTGKITLSTAQINFLCDRRFGIGADGLMLLENAENYDYRMIYFNADGAESTMCGNGGRCIASFAVKIGAASLHQNFIAIDGPHKAAILDGNLVALQMQDVKEIEKNEESFVLNTGSPHFVQFVNAVEDLDVFSEGRNIRNRARFQPKGINVNFVKRKEDLLQIRTYERGVEDETLACGTGVTAAAIASTAGSLGSFDIKVKALGGDLSVTFDKIGEQNIQNVWLKGPAQMVFEGTIEF